MRRLIFFSPVLIFAAVAASFLLGLMREQSANYVPSALIDQPAPEFELPPVREGADGLATADLTADGVSLVNVFASWCIPCKIEHPLLMKLARDKVVPLHGINWKDRRSDAIAWLDQLGDPFRRIGYDGSGRAGIDWGVYGVPETYVIDREGRIRYKHIGPMSQRVLDDTILPLIRELGE